MVMIMLIINYYTFHDTIHLIMEENYVEYTFKEFTIINVSQYIQIQDVPNTNTYNLLHFCSKFMMEMGTQCRNDKDNQTHTASTIILKILPISNLNIYQLRYHP